MAKFLAPIVLGPIFVGSTFISVSGAMAGAGVTLQLRDGHIVASGTATMNGFLELKVSSVLHAGEEVFAKQGPALGSSPLSNTGVPVLANPDPLPTPIFASPV